MIGDNVETDIKGGKAAGLFSILIAASNVKPTADRSQADLIMQNVAAILDYFDHCA
jgi:ribonucleotide monophosphatase NagD (HAD superfamily)